jgi:rRNA-processing protein FCF1
MKKVILDTNFILTCIRNKIDFFEEIKFKGMQILIPKQVIIEIKRINNSKKKLHFREEASIALKILKKSSFKKIDLKNKYVDGGIIKFTEKDKTVIIATLDKKLQKKFQNSKLIIRNKKKLEII